MKTLSIFVLAFLFSLPVRSQDTLFTKNGEMIGAKVIEINQDEIKYKKSSNPDGPLYVIHKTEVVLIEYQNGSRDVFAAKPNNSPADADYDYNGNNNSGRVYSGQSHGVNIVMGALPFFGYRPWYWGWNSPWYGGNWTGHWGRNRNGWGNAYFNGGGGHHHGHHFAQYGRRGGGSHGHR